MRSENARLWRQYWNEPGDYTWVIEFYRRRGLMRTLRAGNVFGGVTTVLALVGLWFETLRGPWWMSHAVVAYQLLCSIGWILFWLFRPWPSVRVAAAMFAFADVGIAVATFLHTDALVALSTTPLFAMCGISIVFFFGPRALAAHMSLATVTIVAATVWVALSHRPDALAVAGAKGLLSWVAAAGMLPFAQFGFWLIRSNSVESLTDPLTELANRRGLANYLERKMKTLAASSNPLCVFVIDLDGFKKINDVHGHTIGDAVITRTADMIRTAVAPSAFVARTGGEEFVVLHPLTLPTAVGIAEAMRAAIEVPTAPRATASIGVAAGVVQSITAFEELHACADEAMYAAKRSGGNRIALADPADGGWVEREITLRTPVAERSVDVDAH